MYLTICDTKQVQSYIFNSNRLKENIGASYLVSQATSTWIAESLPGKSNIALGSDSNLIFDDSALIENGLDAELIYSGGGNALLIFKTEEQSKEFAKKLSIKVLENAPGLDIHIKGVPFSFTKEPLAEKIKELFHILEQSGHFRIRSSFFPTLSVTAQSQVNGQAASHIYDQNKEMRLIDVETLSKAEVADSHAQTWLSQKLPIPDGYAYPLDLDDLGRDSGNFSYIAVVHADGDGIGNRIINLPDKFPAAGKNRELINAIRNFSCSLDHAAKKSVKTAIDKLISFIKQSENEADALLKLKKSSDGKTFLPIRPLIIGGDDITIVCDARIAHSFCTTIMKEFEEETKELPDQEGKASLSAGIAIVKSHYPFSKAYSLSQELLKSAKTKRKNADSKNAYLDWAFMQSGVIDTLSESREREFKCDNGYLHSRPVKFDSDARELNELGTWSYITSCIQEFQSENWKNRRNKLKALRDSLRNGEVAVKEFRGQYLNNKTLPNIETSSPNLSENGWKTNKNNQRICGYFDALEMVDFYLSLEPN